ncbi:MAG: VWA domain-containing protein [Bacteroidaceae bacterium]|nr:VWA domain-containing protein [Bacteroidaceae bacterium]
MKFATPEYLYLLFLVPLAIVIYKYACYRRNRNIKRYGDPQLVSRLMPSHSAKRSSLLFWIPLLAMALIVVALARPRYGKGKTTVTTRGVELVVALDISNSMLADDIYPNRLEKAKRLIKRLAEQLKGNKIALVVFAGDAFVQLPITDDFISIEMFLESVSTNLVSRQGTDIGAAINIASRCFTPNDKIGKAIVLITDGENHEGGAEEAAQKAAESGKKVFILGIGTTKGGRIPLQGGNFLRDREGQVVVSKLNEEMAMNIAKAGNGMYLQVDNTNEAQKILSDQLDRMTKDETTTDVYTGYNELFIYPATLAFILLLLDFILVAMADIKSRKKINNEK